MASHGWYEQKMLKLKKDNIKRRQEQFVLDVQAEKYVPGRYDSREKVCLPDNPVWALQEKYGADSVPIEQLICALF